MPESESVFQDQRGRQISILYPGNHNVHAGPDFTDARICIDSLLWVGNVELHIYASSWYQHLHHLDPAYNNVILHVVWKADCICLNEAGREIPLLELDRDKISLASFKGKGTNSRIPLCRNQISALPSSFFQSSLTRLFDERMFRRHKQLEAFQIRNHHCFEESLFHLLAHSFGLEINSLPFLLTARKIPMEVLYQHRDQLSDLEALLFGMAGFLEQAHAASPYHSELRFRFRRIKEHCRHPTLSLSLWKFLRIRPSSFPTLRLAQFASLVHHYFPILPTILRITSSAELEALMRLDASAFWDTHYTFHLPSSPRVKSTGKQFCEQILINALAPFLMFYGKNRKCEKSVELAYAIFQSLPPENNSIIRNWSSLGTRPSNALESQAIIELYKNYCKQKRCLDCQIGRKLLSRKIL